MEAVQKLKELYLKYTQDAAMVSRNAKPTDGLFGMGDDPRKDPCHMRFYEDTQQWVQEFHASAPEQPAVFEVVRFMILFPAEHRQESSFWFLYAAQGLTRELIPQLNAQQCTELREAYDEHYPRRERMPVQKEVYKLLKKGALRR